MGRKRKVEYYFDEKEEKAFIEYLNCDDEVTKNRLYNTYLMEPFQKMVESILRKYPIHTGGYDLKELEINALGHLVDQMRHFNPDRYNILGKKTKAFSYCQTIVKNFFTFHSKTTYKEKTRNVSYDDFYDELKERPDQHYYIDGDDNLFDNFFTEIIRIIENKIQSNKLSENDVLVGDALIMIFKNWEKLFVEENPEGKYQKKITNKFKRSKIMLYIREITNLEPKDIRASLKEFKEIYFNEKKKKIE